MLDENEEDKGSSLQESVDAEDAPTELTVEGRPRKRLLILGFKALMQVVVSFAVLFGAVGFMNYMVFTQPEVKVRPKREQSFTVVTQPIEIGENRPTISVYGEIVTNRDVELRALVGGEIRRVSPNLKVGEFIDKGSEIATIDDFNYAGALSEAEANKLEAQAKLDELELSVEIQRKNIASAKEQLELAERDLNRAEELKASGNFTDQALDSRKLTVSQRTQSLSQLENSLKVAEVKIEQQKASLERIDWRLKQAERNLENTVLRAPFDAVVKSQNAEVGRLVGVNDVLATLYDRNSLGVRFTLSDEQYGRLLSETGSINGRKVNVIWHIGNDPRTYDAVVDRIGALVASSKGGVDVFAKIKSEGAELLIRPGAFVQVRVPDINYGDSAVIPEAAIYDGSHVFIKSTESRMFKREITVHAYEGEKAFVTGDLQNGDVLIVTHIAEAGDGILVNEIGDPDARSNDGNRRRQEEAANNKGESEETQKTGRGQGKGGSAGLGGASAQSRSSQQPQ